MIILTARPSYPPRVMMQRAGYQEFRDPRSGETSYIRRLGTNFYPRWHAYLVEEAAGLRINLHLDQKQPSYAGFTKHSGEYDGDQVEREGARVAAFFPARG